MNKSTNLRILTLVFLFSHFTTFAQDYQELKKVKYQEVICGNHDNIESSPVLFALHFAGSKPENLIPHFASFNFPIKVVFVLGEYQIDNGFSYYPPDYHQSFSDEKKAESQRQATKRIKRFISAYKKKFSIEYPTSIIGASEGGDLALLLACNYPQLASLSISIAATIQLDAIFKNSSKRTMIKLLHGTEDQIVSIEKAREIHKTLEAKELKIELKEYEGKRHEISAKMIADFTDWIKNNE